LKVNCLDERGEIISDKIETIPLSVHSGVLKRSILEEDDILYSIAGTIGRTTKLENDFLPANCNQAIAIIRANKDIVPSTYLMMAMTQSSFRDLLHANVVHAVQANLSLGMIGNAEIIVPEQKTLADIFKPIDDIWKLISNNRRQSRYLSSLRDTLLPKLISGELRIDDAKGKRGN